MLATVFSSVLVGHKGHPISIEVHVSAGMPGYTIVGLPDASCREARDRVRAAMLSSGFKWPQQRVTINLAPTDLRKEGSSLDLGIALALLAASSQIPLESLDGLAAIGELGLDGQVKDARGAICLAGAIKSDRLITNERNALEATEVFSAEIQAVSNLSDAVMVATGQTKLIFSRGDTPKFKYSRKEVADIVGQEFAKKALEISAAGGHHLLLVGPPGAGKTMLASRLVDILPDLSSERSLVVTQIHSAAGLMNNIGLIHKPPLRAPHNGASLVGMLGGGSYAMRPGEISCAHGGVLFLDELGEYKSSVVDSLRTPLEEGVIRVSRAASFVEYPADFILVAAMNPCPCGSADSTSCRCTSTARNRYYRRVSGPILDRFDLRVEVDAIKPSDLFEVSVSESTDQILKRVEEAREIARERGVECNSKISDAELDKFSPLNQDAKNILVKALEDHKLTARGVSRVRRVACTISDLSGDEGKVGFETILAALGFRSNLTMIFRDQA